MEEQLGIVEASQQWFEESGKWKKVVHLWPDDQY